MTPMGDSAETNAIGNVVERLVRRFPTVTRERVQEVVDGEYARLGDGPVQQYVPALVEHASDERLRNEADPVLESEDPGGPVLVSDDDTDLDPLEIERRRREQRAGFLFGDLGGGSV